MRTYSEALELALMSARDARSSSTKQAARELWKIAKLDNGRLSDLGDPPQSGKPRCNCFSRGNHPT
jgi:hypothetical protein